MKKKILIPVATAIIIILIMIAFNNSNPVTFSNTLPMYGATSYKQYVSKRGSEIKSVDEAFITDATKNQTREEAVKGVIKLGWSYIIKNDLDTAMMRFNQAWLLDQDNFNVQWGYGAIFGTKGELQKSADYFDKAVANYSEAKAVTPNDYLPLWDDAALSYINLSDSYLKTDDKKAKMYSLKALKLLSDSLVQVDKLPKDIIPQEMFLLAVAYFNHGDYKDARGQYDLAVKQYPQIKDDGSAVLFEKALKEKGF